LPFGELIFGLAMLGGYGKGPVPLGSMLALALVLSSEPVGAGFERHPAGIREKGNLPGPPECRA
jgi:hypothetical protein